MSQSDLTFFTNEPGSTLLERFKRTLKDTYLFDVLVGYFRASGFYQLVIEEQSSKENKRVNKQEIILSLYQKKT